MLLLTVGSALISHQVYKRHEPSIYTGGAIFVGGQAALLSWFSYHGLGLSTAIQETATLTFIHVLALTASIFAYRTFWHPLRDFPGPPLAKLSKFWAIPISAQGEMHHLLHRLHQQYGDFVRIGPNELSICNADAVNTIYGPNGWEKGPAYDVRVGLKAGEPDLEALRSHTVHARRRKTWSAAFTTKALLEYQEQFRDRTHQFIDALNDRCGSPVDMRMLFQFFITDVLFDLAFGGRGPQLMKTGKDTVGMFDALLSFLKAVATFGHVPSLTPIAKLLPSNPNVERFLQFCTECYLARVEDESPSPDIFRHLVADISPTRNTGNDKQLLREAQADTILLIIAGSDTTSSVLANTLFLLLSEPELKSFRKLQTELDRAHDDKEDLDWNEIAQRVPLLDCCINEAMRILPPVPAGPLQRKVVRSPP